jgi:hypothetical protein
MLVLAIALCTRPTHCRLKCKLELHLTRVYVKFSCLPILVMAHVRQAGKVGYPVS